MGATEGDKERVGAALQSAGHDSLEAFVLAKTGLSLTEMAEELSVPVQTFIRVHNDWVDENVPPLL